jgi:hypothetical protein
VKGSEKYKKFKTVECKIKTINKERNSVAHSGQFKKGNTAKKMINLSKEIIEVFVQQYTKDFTLDDIR